MQCILSFVKKIQNQMLFLKEERLFNLAPNSVKNILYENRAELLHLDI